MEASSIDEHELAIRKKLAAAAFLWWASGNHKSSYPMEQASIASAQGAWDFGVQQALDDAERLGLPRPKSPGDLPQSYVSEARKDAVDYAARARALGPAGEAFQLEYVIDRIASSQTYAAYNEVRREMLRNSLAEREGDNIFRIWRLGTERPCSICVGLDGVRVPIFDDYPGGYEPGTVHYQCRCTENYEAVMIGKDVQLDLGQGDVHIDGPVGQKAKPMAVKKPKRARKMRPRRKRAIVKIDHPQHGKLEVKYMSARDFGDDSQFLQGLGFEESAVLADKDGKPVWIQIAKKGRYFKDGAFFSLDDKCFDDIVRNFDATTNKSVPIDFEHASEKPGSEGAIPMLGAPAQGWIKQLDNRGDTLWGKVEWGDLAQEYIKSGAYKFISPAVRFNRKDRVTGAPIGSVLTSAGLVNVPFLDGMKPLTAKDEKDSTEVERGTWKCLDENPITMSGRVFSTSEYMPRLKACLKMGELNTATECKEQLGRLRGHFDSAGGDPQGAPQGIDLGSYMLSLRDAVGANAGMTWDDVFDLVEDMIDDAIDEHEDGVDCDDVDMKDAAEAIASTEVLTKTSDAIASPSKELTMDITEVQLKDALKSAAVFEVQLKDSESAKTRLENELSAAKKDLKDAVLKLDKLELEMVTMKAEADKHVEAEAVREVDTAILAYGKSKGITATNKPAMLRLLKAAPESFREMYAPVDASKLYLMKETTTPAGNVPGTKEATLNPGHEDVQSEIPSQDVLIAKYTKEGMSLEMAVSTAFTDAMKARAQATMRAQARR